MILKKINPDRAAFIIGESLGVQLKDFFTKYQKKLILGKHKVQNLPKEFQKSIKILLDLNDEEFELFRTWGVSVLSRSSDNIETAGVAEAIGYFLVCEYKLASGLRSKEKDRLYSRAVLEELLKEDPDPSLIEFLSSNIPYGKVKESSVPSTESNPQDVFNQKIMSMILDDAFPENLDDLKEESKAVSINFDTLKDRLEKLQRGRISESPSTLIPEGSVEIQRSRFLTREDKIDLEEVTVYAYVINTLDSGLRFLMPIAIETDGQLVHLDKDEAKAIFPNTGNLVWYPSDQKRTLGVNEFGIFTVELSNVARRSPDATTLTLYAVKQFISKLDCVVKVENSVRSLPKLGQWLRQNEEHLAISESLLLYRNELIKPHFKDNKHIQFETKMEVLDSPRILEIDHKLYVHDFKTSERYYDFSPIDLIVKRLIKQSNESANKLTKAQLAGLIQNLEEFKVEAPLLDPHYYDETINLINEFVSSQENLELLVEDILELKAVKQRVDDAISIKLREVESGFEGTKAALSAELGQIKSQVDDAKKALKSEEEKARKLKSSLASDISRIYSEAVEDGKRILSQSALFEGIVGKVSGPVVEMESSFTIHDFDGSKLDSEGMYKLFPPGKGYKDFIELLKNIHEMGFSFVITGTFAPFVAQLLALQISKKQIDVKVIDVYPGASKFPEIVLENVDQTLLLRNFDISPISVYGRKLLEDAYTSFHLKNSVHRKQLILVKEDTGLGLNTPKVLEMFSVHVDTDFIEDQERAELIEFDEFEEMLKTSGSHEKLKGIVRALRNNVPSVSFKDDPKKLSSALYFLARNFSESEAMRNRGGQSI